MLRKLSKKGQIGNVVNGIFGLASVAIAIVVIGLVSAFGSDIIDDTQTDFVADTQAYNNTVEAQAGIGELTERIDTVALVTVAVFIIAILVTGFGGFMVMRR